MENILFDTITEKYSGKNINGTNVSVFKHGRNDIFYIHGDHQELTPGSYCFRVTIQVFTKGDERTDISEDKFVKQAVVCMVYLGYPEDRTGCDIVKDIYDMVDWFNGLMIPVEMI